MNSISSSKYIGKVKNYFVTKFDDIMIAEAFYVPSVAGCREDLVYRKV